MSMSLRIQEILLWWSIVFGIIFVLAWAFVIGMIPLPPATWTSAEVAAFYTENQTRIRWGAAICSWTAGFWIPFTMVVGAQIARLEKGFPILAIMQIVSGCIQALTLVIPAVIWGVCAFTPERLPDVTAAFHEFSILFLVCLDQIYIFQWAPWIIITFMVSKDPLSPFPRWFAYFLIWSVVMYECAAIGFTTKTGLFAWDGLLVFYIPFGLLFITCTIFYPLLFKAIKRQREESSLEESSLNGGLAV